MSRTSSSSSAGGIRCSAPSRTSTRHVPQLAQRQQNGMGASYSSQACRNDVPAATSISTILPSRDSAISCALSVIGCLLVEQFGAGIDRNAVLVSAQSRGRLRVGNQEQGLCLAPRAVENHIGARWVERRGALVQDHEICLRNERSGREQARALAV